MTISDYDIPLTQMTGQRAPVVYRFCRSLSHYIYSLSNAMFGALPELIRTILLDMIILVSIFAIAFQILLHPALEIASIIAIALPMVILFLAPVYLLSIETILTRDIEIEDKEIVLKALRKKVFSKQTRNKSVFSAFGSR